MSGASPTPFERSGVRDACYVTSSVTDRYRIADCRRISHGTLDAKTMDMNHHDTEGQSYLDRALEAAEARDDGYQQHMDHQDAVRRSLHMSESLYAFRVTGRVGAEKFAREEPRADPPSATIDYEVFS